MNAQAREALEVARSWILAVAHRVEGHAVVEKIDAALSAPTEQVPADGREAAEWHYTVSAFDIGAFPVGSRDWSLFFSGWPASRSHYASPSASTVVQPAETQEEADRRGMASMSMPVRSAACRDDGRCQYAIDSGAEGLGHCPAGKCVRPATPTAVKEAGGVDAELLDALNDLVLNVREAMGTGGWVPTPLQASFVAAMAEAGRVISKAEARAAQPAIPVAPRAFRTPEPGTPWWQTAKDCGAWTDRQEGDVGYVHFGSTEALRVYTVKITNQVRKSLAAQPTTLQPNPKEQS